MSNMLRPCFMVVLGCALVTGCGAQVFRPAASTQLGLDSAQEIDDEDIRKAFEAHPQMRAQQRIAFYSFDPDKADTLETMLRALPGVTGTYRIPSLLTTGQRRYEEHNPWSPPPQPLSVKKLRLLAARAHCDLLVVFDYGSKTETSANAWAILDVLILPTFFTPFLDVEASSYTDAFIVDTRNGYLYAQVTAQKADSHNGVTIYSTTGTDLIQAQWPQLARETSNAIQKVLESERTSSPQEVHDQTSPASQGRPPQPFQHEPS